MTIENWRVLAFQREVILFCSLKFCCFETFSLSFASSLLKLPTSGVAEPDGEGGGAGGRAEEAKSASLFPSRALTPPNFFVHILQKKQD